MAKTPRPLVDLLREPGLAAARRAAAGLECHLVGGVLRDAGLGLPRRDIDLVVPGDAVEFARRLASLLAARLVALGGDRFAAFRLVTAESTIDVWGRGEATLDADLERRDFTINAMALDIEDGELCDPLGGWTDLRGRILRVASPQSFVDDPLRTLRAVRFVVTLPGFALSAETLVSARQHAPRLDRIAGERVRVELGLVLAAPEPAAALDQLAHCTLASRLWLDRSGHFDSWPELVRLVGLCAPLETPLAVVAGREVERAVWLHGLVARALGQGEAAPSRAVVDDLEQRRYVTRAEARKIRRLATSDALTLAPGPRRFLAEHGETWPEAALVTVATEARESLPGRWLAGVRRLLQVEGSDALDPRPFVDGAELRRLLGLSPGPEVGRLLALLRDAQIDGDVRSRDEAIAFLKALDRG